MAFAALEDDNDKIELVIFTRIYENMERDGYFVENKLLLYYLQIHSNQLEYDAKRKFAKTITINLLDFNFFKADSYHQKLLIKTNPDSNGNREKLEMHVIELPKFKNKEL